jgi:hypothetical protein
VKSSLSTVVRDGVFVASREKQNNVNGGHAPARTAGGRPHPPPVSEESIGSWCTGRARADVRTYLLAPCIHHCDGVLYTYATTMRGVVW